MNLSQNKIIPFDQVNDIQDETVVLCHGHFNVIHPGHIRYLEYARAQGKKLVVTVLGDATFLGSEKKYHFSESERAASVASIKIVDMVILLGDKKLEDAVQVIKPDFLVLGNEFELERHEKVRIAVERLKVVGGKVLYHAGETNYASTDLFKHSQLNIQEERYRQFKHACAKQDLSIDLLLETINKFSKASLLIIGDTIVDQYVACDALGMSAEAPVVVLRELDLHQYVGGAAVVALHAKSLGAQCRFLSVVGQDQNINFVSKALNDLSIEHNLIEDQSRPTTLKIRYLVESQKMFRVSRLKDHNIQQSVEDQLIEKIRQQASEVRGILISDFSYGVITSRVLEAIHEEAIRHNLLVIGDIQCSSQIGNITKFKNFDLICPTEREARIALGVNNQGVEWVSHAIMDKTGSKNIIMKLGPEGFIVYGRKTDGLINRQHFPALNPNPIDVAGAGDSLLAALSVGLCSGATLMQSSALGSCMASLAVGNLGNLPVNDQQLVDLLKRLK